MACAAYSWANRYYQEYKNNLLNIKRERTEDEDRSNSARPRKVAKAYAGDTLLELDDGGSFRERSETLQAKEKVVIELD